MRRRRKTNKTTSTYTVLSYQSYISQDEKQNLLDVSFFPSRIDPKTKIVESLIIANAAVVVLVSTHSLYSTVLCFKKEIVQSLNYNRLHKTRFLAKSNQIITMNV